MLCRRQESDHGPLHLVCKSQEDNIIRAFRYQNFWSKHKDFISMVKRYWVTDFMGDLFLELNAKLKKVKKGLREWSKEEFGNIFIKKATIEDILSVKELQFEIDLTPENRAQLHKVEAELRRYLKLEEDFWRKKSGMSWFTMGDKNTMFFHSYVQGKRKKLFLKEIYDEQEVTVNTTSKIGMRAVDFFETQFREENMSRD